MTSPKSIPQLTPRKAVLGCFKQRSVWLPTWRGWLLLLLVLLALCWSAIKVLPAFLTVHHPLQAQVLVVEGWVPDYGIAAAAAEFKRGGYQRLYVTGGPLEKGVPLSQFKTYAELGAAVAVGLGMKQEDVIAVPAPGVRTDRTYISARTLKRLLQGQLSISHRLNVISVGPHSRRSRLLFQKAFADDWEIGMISVPDQSYDVNYWYRSSNGVRNILSEAIAYLYARIFFRTPNPALQDSSIQPATGSGSAGATSTLTFRT